MLRNRRIPVIVSLLTILTAVPVWSVNRQMHQANLNRMLFLAEMSGRYDQGVLLLKQGADAAVHFSNIDNGTIEDRVLKLVSRLTSRASTPERNNRDYVISDMYVDCDICGLDTRANGSVHPDFERFAVALLEAGSPTDVTNLEGTPLIELAVRVHNHSVIKTLLRLNPGLIRMAGPALVEADAIDAATLIAYGANIEGRDQYGRTPILNADAAKIKLLVDHGAKTDVVEDDGETPLLMACRNGDDDAVNILLNYLPALNPRDKRGETPLLRAVARCQFETVKKLAALGADVRARNSSGDSSLILSLMNPDERVFRWLLGQGIDANLCGGGENTALTCAEQFSADYAHDPKYYGGGYNRFPAIIKRLQQHGARSVRPRGRWDKD